jgi:hypothetical protein
MAVAILALVIALGGTGWAAVNLPRDSVGTAQLKDQAVTKQKLHPRAVHSQALAARAVGRTQLADGGVSASKLADGSVGDAKLAPSLLSAIQSPTIRFTGKGDFGAGASQPGTCGGSHSTTIPAETLDRLVFFSYSAVRTAQSGTTDYAAYRPAGNVAFQLTGAASRSGEGFFAVPAGSTFPEGASVNADDCAGSGGTLDVHYYVLALQPPPSQCRSSGAGARRGCRIRSDRVVTRR